MSNYTCKSCRHRFSSASLYTPRCPKCRASYVEKHGEESSIEAPTYTSYSAPDPSPSPSFSGGCGDSGGGGASGDW